MQLIELSICDPHDPHISTEQVENVPTFWDWSTITPGTRWCGDGDNAENYDDLGYFVGTDTCCREHDHCNETISAGESKYGLFNPGKYTRLHCECDFTFYNCLQNATCYAAGIVAITYFNMLDTQCYEFAHPAKCIQTYSILGYRERCVKYAFNKSQPKHWQWFDVPRWLGGQNNKQIECKH